MALESNEKSGVIEAPLGNPREKALQGRFDHATVLEEWRPVVGYECFYSVSNLGRVKRTRSACGAMIGKIMVTSSSSRHGYPNITLAANGTKKTRLVHQLVAAAFIGRRPKGFDINHKNAIKTDNRVTNLEYVTRKENAQHALRMGLRDMPNGAKSGASTLSRDQVLSIRSEYSYRKTTLQMLATKHGCAIASIHRILERKTWKHLQ